MLRRNNWFGAPIPEPEQLSIDHAGASLPAIQALIEVSGLIRAMPARSQRRAADYVDVSYLDEARRARG